MRLMDWEAILLAIQIDSNRWALFIKSRSIAYHYCIWYSLWYSVSVAVVLVLLLVVLDSATGPNTIGPIGTLETDSLDRLCPLDLFADEPIIRQNYVWAPAIPLFKSSLRPSPFPVSLDRSFDIERCQIFKTESAIFVISVFSILRSFRYKHLQT